MRYPTGCENCRERHVKCEIPDGSTVCRRCEERNEDCTRTSSLRFREVTSISSRTSRGRTEKRKIKYGNGHKWMRMTGSVNFVQEGEDPRPASGGTGSHGDSPRSEGSTLSTSHNETNEAMSEPSTRSQPLTTPYTPHTEQESPTAKSTRFPPLVPTHSFDPTQGQASTTPQEQQSPGPHAAKTTAHIPLLYRTDTLQPITSRKEAYLLRHFIDHQAPELDVCDLLCHFAREVPHRAMYCPALLNAILAFASRNMSVIEGLEDNDSERYHSQCLQWLIPALNEATEVVDENLLTTVVILRLYEERAKVEEEYHRLGQTRLINTISAFASSGGMAEAATWLSLRQEIRASFTTKRVFKIQLGNYAGSRAFIDEDGGSWANRIIFITAKVLATVFQDTQEMSCREWNELDDEIEHWNARKPTNFDPLWTASPVTFPVAGTLDGNESESAFPEIIMSQDAHVVGAQYYCMSKLLLASHNPHIPRVGFGAVKQRRDADCVAVEQLRNIVGLAISNKACQNASVTATYALHACGFWLSGSREQEEAIDFLYRIERLMGWNTGQIIPSLRAYWTVETQ